MKEYCPICGKESCVGRKLCFMCYTSLKPREIFVICLKRRRHLKIPRGATKWLAFDQPEYDYESILFIEPNQIKGINKVLQHYNMTMEDSYEPE